MTSGPEERIHRGLAATEITCTVMGGEVEEQIRLEEREPLSPLSHQVWLKAMALILLTESLQPIKAKRRLRFPAKPKKTKNLR